MSTVVMESKLVDESLSVVVSFLSRLAVGETVQTTAVVASLASGTDATPSAILSGVGTITGADVSQRVIGGLAGNIYMLTFSIRTSANNIYINRARVAVLSNTTVTPAAFP